MSAFIVDDLHINALISYAIDKRISYWNDTAREHVTITDHNAEEVGRILMDENVRSVCARYASASDEEKNAGGTYRYERFPDPLTSVEIIKACQCLDYQSCETEDWEASLAWRILQSIKSAACHYIPGYDAAPWAISERSRKELKHTGAILLSTPRQRSR